MQWPVPPAPDAGAAAVPSGRAAAPAGEPVDLASDADARFESVCDELGILVARRVEPVAARVLPFGTEQVAMVEVRTVGDDERRTPVADAVTPGRSVLAAALPAAVAEGKVRSAVVFSDGEAPVRWGRADDETRLAALYAVVPHLGSFTATAGADTYRVLRLPGIGAALVSEGESAATWVEGWFAALVTATRFALAAQQVPTGVVAAPAAPSAEVDTAGARAAVLEQLESECRRILAAAQNEAREIREAAERDAAARSDRGRRRDAPPRDGASDATAHEVRAEVDAMLASAERARAEVLADARREAEALRRETEQACAELREAAQRDADRRRRAARRDVKRIRRRLKSLRRDAAKAKRAVRTAPSPRMADVVVDARRAADDLLADARRAADELLRDAARSRAQSFAPVAPVVPVVPAAPVAPATASTEEAQRTAIALLTAATESVAAMSALLASVADAGRRTKDGDDAPSSRLYFGA